MKKLLNEVKADPFASTVYHTLDIASGGLLSLIEQSMAQITKGLLEAKFNNLIVHVLSDDLSETDILEFINSESQSNRDFISNIILKNMHADNRITTFLLAKLWVQKMKNGSLGYYESSLFTNINVFTYQDFEGFYNIWKNKSSTKNGFYYCDITENERYYRDVQIKLFSFGILHEPNVHGSFFATENTPIDIALKLFERTGSSEILFNLLSDFFEK